MRFELWPRGMKLRHRRWLWLWFVLVVGIFIVLYDVFPLFRSTEIVIAILTGIFGCFYFLQQQHIEQARFFKELVTEFNQRYDKLNNKLLSILENDGKLENEQKQVFIDYFNLCAEEYLFYEAGYIYERVWNAWSNGMKQFGRDNRIVELWKKEIQTNSYYNFEFPVDN